MPDKKQDEPKTERNPWAEQLREDIRKVTTGEPAATPAKKSPHEQIQERMRELAEEERRKSKQ